MTRLRLASFLVLMLLPALASVSRATPVSYGVEFDVQFICSTATPCFEGAPAPAPATDPRLAIGNEYWGSFTVDSAILALDGLNKLGDVSAFSIAMEDVSWTLGIPGFGFRNGLTGFGVSPGFDVLNGQITNLRGDIHSPSDFPWVDFSTSYLGDPYSRPADPANTPCASFLPYYCGGSPGMFSTSNPLGAFGGSMRVFAIPEPETYAMVLIGLAALGLAIRRRRAN